MKTNDIIGLTNTDMAYIKQIADVAKLVNISELIIEPGQVRGISEDRTALIMHTADVVPLSCSSIAISRINTLLFRLSIVQDKPGFACCASMVVDAMQSNKVGAIDVYPQLLTMTSKGSKIDFRCANPNLLRIPKSLNDVKTHTVKMNSDAVDVLSRGQAAMSSDEVALSYKDGAITFEFKDVNGDLFTHDVTTDVRTIGSEASAQFYYKYPIKTLLPLFKRNPDGYFNMSSKGVLYIMVNGITVVVLPRR